MEDSSQPRAFRYFFALLLILIILGSTLKLASNYVWDDAYMFARYADRLLEDGVLAFNQGAEATYGLTSLAYLLVVIPFQWLIPNHPGWVVFLSSWTSGILFLGCLILFLRRHLPGSRAWRSAGLLLVLFSLGKGMFLLSSHFASGMDTLFSLFYLTAYFWFAKAFEESPTGRRGVLLGSLGGIAFWVRPDLLVFTWCIALAITLFPSSKVDRRLGLWVLGTTIGATALCSGMTWWFLHSPLPLPFFAKGLGLYGEFIHYKYRYIPGTQLLAFLQAFVFLAVPLLLFPLVDPKRFWRSLSPVDRGIGVALPLFGSYYLFGVLQIMFYQSRFFFPLLPGLAYLGAKSAIELVRGWNPDLWTPVTLADHKRATAGIALFSLAILWVIPDPLARLFLLTKDLDRTLNLKQHVTGRPDQNWFMLSDFSKGPDDLVIATTEVGLPLALNPNKTIIDVAGLNDTVIAHEGFKAKRFFERYQPDILYLPHPDYQEMILEIRSDPFFIEYYEFFPAESIRTNMSVALYRDSRHYASMRAIMLMNLQRLGVLKAEDLAKLDSESRQRVPPPHGKESSRASSKADRPEEPPKSR